MKAVLALCLLGLAIVAADYTEGHNGRPGCHLAVEFTKPWRNNFDPTRYWMCDSAHPGTPGKEVPCKSQMAYYDPAEKCVDWGSWQWTPPQDPPSLA